MLEGLPQVSEAEARRAAAAFLGLREDIFTLSAQGEGQLPTWGFSALVNGGELYVEVTRQGGPGAPGTLLPAGGRGVPLRPGGAAEGCGVSVERGYQDMDPSYSIQQGGILTVHFASRQDGVYCYPDLVKVGVALDTGDVVSFESEGYLMNHGDRTLPAPGRLRGGGGRPGGRAPSPFWPTSSP